MKKGILVSLGMIVGVSLAIVAIGYLFYTQINYVDLVGKRAFISENGTNILIEDNEGSVVLSYNITQWRSAAGNKWEAYFEEGIEVNETEITPDSFTRFIAVSPFPGGSRTLGFAVATPEGPQEMSLFWTMNVSTEEISLVGDVNIGSVGSISWSPQGSYFAYYLNTEDAPGEYLTVDNAFTMEKEFVLSGDDILEKLEEEENQTEFHPEFGGLDWSEDGTELFFITKSPENDEEIRWSIKANGDNFQKLEDVDLEDSSDEEEN